MSGREADDEPFDAPAYILARPQGEPFSVERARAEQRASAAAHKQQMEAEDARLRREETRKENELRRHRELVGFYVVVGASVVVLVISLGVAVVTENDERQAWAQSIVTLVMGGIVGGLAGYLTGRTTK